MGFLQHYYAKVSADYSDPAADAAACCGVTGHSDEREGHFGGFCPFEGVSGSVSFSQHPDSSRALRRSPERHQGRAIS